MRNRPTYKELLGIGLPEQDLTDNEKYTPNLVPSRTSLPGRGDPSESLDRFSPEAQGLDYDFGEEDEFERACPSIHEHAQEEMNSQRDPGKDCPSVFNPTRFVHQNRAGRKG